MKVAIVSKHASSFTFPYDVIREVFLRELLYSNCESFNTRRPSKDFHMSAKGCIFLEIVKYEMSDFWADDMGIMRNRQKEIYANGYIYSLSRSIHNRSNKILIDVIEKHQHREDMQHIEIVDVLDDLDDEWDINELDNGVEEVVSTKQILK